MNISLHHHSKQICIGSTVSRSVIWTTCAILCYYSSKSIRSDKKNYSHEPMSIIPIAENDLIPDPRSSGGHRQTMGLKAYLRQYRPFFLASPNDKRKKNLARGWRSPTAQVEDSVRNRPLLLDLGLKLKR
jgi:hypothetical protein